MTDHFATLGDMLLKRYVVDFVGQMQQLSSPSPLWTPERKWRCPKCFGDGNEPRRMRDSDGSYNTDLTHPCEKCLGYPLLAMPYELFWDDEELTELLIHV